MSDHFVWRRGGLVAALAMAMALAGVAESAVAMPGTANLSALRSGVRYDRFMVTYRAGHNDAASALGNVSSAFTRAGLNSGRSAGTVRYMRQLGSGAQLLRTPRRLDVVEATRLMREIASDPAVVHVEPDVLRQAVRDYSATDTMAAVAGEAPNDPSYAQYQWNLFDPTGGVDAPSAWPLSRGDGMLVGVLDTGITAHPDLDTSLADSGYDFITDPLISGRASEGRAAGGWDTGDWTDTSPYIDNCGNGESSTWHGTHVAGTIAERTDNGVGLAGVAYNARVLPVRVLGHCGGYDSDIADAVTWVSGGHVDGVPDNTHPVQVINMSLGGGGSCTTDDVLGSAIQGAIGRGVTVVVAAGNDGADAAYTSPASCPGVIVVGATGISGKRSFYSNYGSTVTLAAPGGGVYAGDADSGEQVDNGFVWSSINTGKTVPAAPGYAGMAGTSQATPHVAAIAAMVQSGLLATGQAPLKPARMASLLRASARPFPQPVDLPVGAGIVNAAEALSMAGVVGAPDASTQVLLNGKPLSTQHAVAGGALAYRMTVPFGAGSISLRTLGGSGTVALYVKRGSAPVADGSDADYRSLRAGTSQVVVLPPGAASGPYYLRLVATTAFSNVTVLGAYGAITP